MLRSNGLADRLVDVHLQKCLWSEAVPSWHEPLVFSILLPEQWPIVLSADFNPSAVMFAPHHREQILISDLGIVLWLAGVVTAIYYRGFAEVFRVYLAPYLWCVIVP